jgi:capsid protein
MSFQITTAFVKQYHGIVEMLVQQKGSRLRECVRQEAQNSEEQFWEQIGPTDAQEIVTRHGDSPLVSTPHDRRRVTLQFFDWGDMIDSIDRVQMLIDPANPYAQNAAYALGRKLDDIIIASQFGTAFTGKAGTTSTTFPAGQQVAVNFGGANSGLTVAKLIEARRLLLAANVDVDMEQLYIAVTAKQLANLLSTTQVTNADYNTVKALVKGEVDSFMGFTFKYTERLLTDGSGYRRVPVWAKSGILLAVNPDITTRVVERSDKRFSTYVYAKMGAGAVRMQESKVIEIKCDETV